MYTNNMEKTKTTQQSHTTFLTLNFFLKEKKKTNEYDISGKTIVLQLFSTMETKER